MWKGEVKHRIRINGITRVQSDQVRNLERQSEGEVWKDIIEVRYETVLFSQTSDSIDSETFR